MAKHKKRHIHIGSRVYNYVVGRTTVTAWIDGKQHHTSHNVLTGQSLSDWSTGEYHVAVTPAMVRDWIKGLIVDNDQIVSEQYVIGCLVADGFVFWCGVNKTQHRWGTYLQNAKRFSAASKAQSQIKKFDGTFSGLFVEAKSINAWNDVLDTNYPQNFRLFEQVRLSNGVIVSSDELIASIKSCAGCRKQTLFRFSRIYPYCLSCINQRKVVENNPIITKRHLMVGCQP